jgi:group I intron endonuclease
MSNSFHFVYCTTNKFNNKVYVGRHTTSNIGDGYLGSGKYFKRALKKYGRENFMREILQFCDSLEDLMEKEEFWIKEFKAVKLGYNISKTSGGWGPGELHPNYGKIPYNKGVPKKQK